MQCTDRDKVRRDDEAGKVIAYLDNATIINACSILTDPAKFDVYKLLDLESFCEAFLLYDCVRTLVGHSFACGFSSCYVGERWTGPLRPGGEESIRPKVWVSRSRTSTSRPSGSHGDPIDTVSLYESLIDCGLLRPVILSAGTVHYHVEHMDLLDEVSEKLDLRRTRTVLYDVFGSGIPWEYSEQGSRRGRSNPESQALNCVVIGEETWTSDSYPVYYFPKPKGLRRQRPKEEIDFGWEINNNRQTDALDMFLSQAFLYVVQAAFHKKPYISSSVRLPVVQEMVKQLGRQFVSVVHASLRSVGTSARLKAQAALDFLGEGAVESLFLPVLFAVLREAGSRARILPTLFAMREKPEVRSFRTWCQSLEAAWREEDLDRVYAAIQQLEKVSAEIGSAISVEPLAGSLYHIPDVAALTREGLARVREEEDTLLRSCYSPSLAFAKDLGTYLSGVGSNRRLCEDVLEHKFTDEDTAMLKSLQSRRDKLYSPGATVKNHRAVSIQKLEVTVGDSFKDIHNSVIATRGSLAEGIVAVREAGKSDVAKALSELAEFINTSKEGVISPEQKAQALELLDGIAGEASKPEPKKNILRSLGLSLQKVLTDVAPLAGAAKLAYDVIASLCR